MAKPVRAGRGWFPRLITPTLDSRPALVCSLAAAAVLMVIAPAAWPSPILLVWNSSASAPEGLYFVQPGSRIARGDTVIAWLPPAARAIANRRGYLPTGIPLVKKVVATAGDRVCAAGKSVLVSGGRVTTRLRRDRSRRILPWWGGCRRLGPGDYFLLSRNPESFDGRYFGISNQAEIVGKGRLLWRR